MNPPPRKQSRTPGAFTLIEVMIAIAIFFVAIFAILDLVTQNVRAAHSLSKLGPTAGMRAAELSMSIVTNKAIELGESSGDFGDIYPGYEWVQYAEAYDNTNKLVFVEIAVLRNGNMDSRLQLLMFDPNFKADNMGNAGQKVFSDGPRGPRTGGGGMR